jgi:hypothetical protein
MNTYFSRDIAHILLRVYFRRAKLSAQEAGQHVGEQATVCGAVVSAHYATRSKGRPTFLNFDEPYPNPVFTVLIWGEDCPNLASQKTSGANGCVRQE